MSISTTETPVERRGVVDPTAVQGDPFKGPDPDTGRLLDVPRVKILTDDTDPTVIRVTFSGKVDLTRSNSHDVDWYNQLVAGKPFSLTVEGHVAGSKTTHRRDSEGDVDSVVQTKSLTIDSVTGLE